MDEQNQEQLQGENDTQPDYGVDTEQASPSQSEDNNLQNDSNDVPPADGSIHIPVSVTPSMEQPTEVSVEQPQQSQVESPLAVVQPEQQPVAAESPSQLQYQSGSLTQSGVIGAELASTTPIASADSISWSASEFVHHEKSAAWYLLVCIASLAVAAAIYFVTKELFSAIVIAIVGVAFSALGALKPKVLEYAIAPDGIKIGEKHFSFEAFRSFAVIEDGAMPSLQLLPHKRLAIAITMYFEPKDGDKIVNILGEYLPFEHRTRELVDKLAAKIRF